MKKSKVWTFLCCCLILFMSWQSVFSNILYNNNQNPSTINYQGTNLTKVVYGITQVWSSHINPVGTIWSYSYAGGIQSFTALDTGAYELNIYGAQGGYQDVSPGALGGQAYGYIKLTAGQTIYICIGGQGGTGYNGGGKNGSGSFIHNPGGAPNGDVWTNGVGGGLTGGTAVSGYEYINGGWNAYDYC